jgi:hypothetical protein
MPVNLTTLKILMHNLFLFRSLLLVCEALLGRVTNFGNINEYVKTGAGILGLLLHIETCMLYVKWIYPLVLRLTVIIE